MQSIKHFARSFAAGIVASFLVSYVADLGLLRYRVWQQQSVFAQVVVTEYLAIPLKNGRTQYEFQQPHIQSCVKALYPHMDTQPCWYVRRHRERRIDVLR